MLREAVDLFIKGMPPGDRSVQVDLDCNRPLPRVRGDAGRLMQVLLNLLGNAREAIRRSGQKGRIIVRTGTSQDDAGSWVTIEVADEGTGIPEPFLERIFEPFFTTREEGTGYGLYLAAQILKEQAGRLTARNNPERGATFTIWLPESKPEESGSVATRTAGETG